MAIKVTHKDFLERLYERSEHYRNGEFDVVGEYKNTHTHLLVTDGELEYSVTPSHLLKGSGPNIKNCLDRDKYIMKTIEKENKHIFNQILGVKYFNKYTSKPSIFKTIYGDVKVSYQSLRKLKELGIISAVDKKEFFINKAKIHREDYDNIDYSKAIYNKGRGNVELRCKIHNYTYHQRPSHHISGTQGCAYCMKSIIMYSKENFKKHKYFFEEHKSYLYVLKAESEKESFYKVGMASKNSFKARLNQIKKNYEIEILYKQEGYSEDIYDLEQRFLEEFKSYSYTPEKDFSGKTECLTVNPVHLYYDWYKNYINYE